MLSFFLFQSQPMTITRKGTALSVTGIFFEFNANFFYCIVSKKKQKTKRKS